MHCKSEMNEIALKTLNDLCDIELCWNYANLPHGQTPQYSHGVIVFGNWTIIRPITKHSKL
jgi:hypothetical protein